MAFGEVEFVPVPVPAVEPFWYPAGFAGRAGRDRRDRQVEALLLARRFFRWE